MSYQGWSNYPTWCMSLWMNNDEGIYHEKQDVVRRMAHRGKHAVGDGLRDLLEPLLPDVSGFASDLLTWAFEQTDWVEIAESELRGLGDEQDA